MIESKFKGITFIICLFVISSMFLGCAPAPTVVKLIDLNRDRYICKLDPSKFNQYQGKRILLSSIEDESKNTTNFYYYNPQQTIGYNLYYSSSSLQQPVVSYYWYALQKAFECAGIKIEEDGSIYDAELSLTFNSLTDEEIQFVLDLRKNDKLAYTKDYTVRMPNIEASKTDILEQRAYGMLDSIVTMILNDPNFQKALLINAVPSVYGDQKYEKIRGIILKNGTVIRGEVLKMNANIIQIRTKQGKILSYSFVEEVESLITK